MKMQDQKDAILRFFPASLRSPWENSNLQWSEIEEIRIRVNQPVIIRKYICYLLREGTGINSKAFMQRFCLRL